MFDTIRKAIIQNREDDALLYEYALTEIESNVILKGLWAKAMALSEGNDNKIQPLYMQFRVQSIKDEFTKLNIAYKEMKKDPLFRKINALHSEPVVSNESNIIVEKEMQPKYKPKNEIDRFYEKLDRDLDQDIEKLEKKIKDTENPVHLNEASNIFTSPESNHIITIAVGIIIIFTLFNVFK